MFNIIIKLIFLSTDNFRLYCTCTYNYLFIIVLVAVNYSQAEVKASLNRGTARDEKLQQTMNLTFKRLNTYQQVSYNKFLDMLSDVLPNSQNKHGAIRRRIDISTLTEGSRISTEYRAICAEESPERQWPDG